MVKDKRIDIRLSEAKVEQIRVAAGDKEMSEYIREAIDLRLESKSKLDNDITNISNKVNEISTKLIEQKIVELLTKQQIIFKEINKQNEVIKLIHRRATFAANFSKCVLNDLKKSSEFSKEEMRQLSEITEKEIKEIGL